MKERQNMEIIRIKNLKKDKTRILNIFEGKNINFLLGAGASMPYLKTLSLGKEVTYTFEDLYEWSVSEEKDGCTEALAQFYIDHSLKHGTYLRIDESDSQEADTVKRNYRCLIENLYKLLCCNSTQKPKRINLFTTNYDMFFEYTFDQMIPNYNDIYFNDGSFGVKNKTVTTERFHIMISSVGVDSKFKHELPIFNLIKLHGSLNWKTEKERIIIFDCKELDEYKCNDIEYIDQAIQNKKTIQEAQNGLENYVLFYAEDNGSKNLLNSLTIVQPRKKKFEETIFQEHYYQGLRILSQELERPQTVLICFGFSFADEHIRKIVRRSAMNPELLILIICYGERDEKSFSDFFSDLQNVIFIRNCLNGYSEGFGCAECKMKMKESDNCPAGDFGFLNSLLEIK